SAGAHTGTETMLTGTAAVIRLKSPLSHCYSPHSFKRRSVLGKYVSNCVCPKPSAIFVHYLFMSTRSQPQKGHASPRVRLNKSKNSSRFGQISHCNRLPEYTYCV